jgi:hypothetical protein
VGVVNRSTLQYGSKYRSTISRTGQSNFLVSPPQCSEYGLIHHYSNGNLFLCRRYPKACPDATLIWHRPVKSELSRMWPPAAKPVRGFASCTRLYRLLSIQFPSIYRGLLSTDCSLTTTTSPPPFTNEQFSAFTTKEQRLNTYSPSTDLQSAVLG